MTTRRTTDEKAHPGASVLFETLRARVVVIDGAGRIIDANPALCALTGMARPQFVGRPAPHDFWPVNPLRIGPAGAPTGWVATFVDRRDAIRAEQEVRDSEERHRSIVETAVVAIITIGEDGAIETVNPAATRMFGYLPHELVGRNVSMLMPEPDSSRRDGHLRRYLEAGERRVIGIGRRVTGLRKNGETFAMHLSVGEMWVGGRRAFTGLVRDETAAAAAEADLRSARDEQEALRRLAMTVAVEAPPEVVFAQAAEIVARLLGVPFGPVARFEGLEAHIMGSWTPHGAAVAQPPRDLRGDGALAEVHRSGKPASVAGHGELADEENRAGPAAPEDGTVGSAAHPVRVGGAVWGAVLVGATGADAMPEDSLERLAPVAHLVGLSVADAEARSRLSSLAMTDSLTGLPNHRAFQERLRTEVGRARRHARSLSLVLLEISSRGFTEIGELTLSAGVCEMSLAERADDLVRLADGALHWAKRHGRDVAYLYSPEVVRELSAAQRVEHLSRRQAFAGIRALARAVDAKDSMASRHSERVADLASSIAGRGGWSDARRALLHEAALLHDIGKVGVPDAILLAPRRLIDE